MLLRIILLNDDNAQVDSADIDLSLLNDGMPHSGSGRTHMGNGKATQAAKDYLWNAYVAPNINPLIKVAKKLLATVEGGLVYLDALDARLDAEAKSKADGHAYVYACSPAGQHRAAITEAHMIMGSAIPAMKREWSKEP